MTFKEINSYALSQLEKLAKEKKVTGDTFCVICSRSGKYFLGMSSGEGDSKIPAERAALGSMVMAGETLIETILLIGTKDKKPILPTKEMVNYLFTVNAENANGDVAMPDKNVPLSTIGDAPAAPAAVSKVPASKNLLLDRVNSLLEGVDEDDEDDEEFLEELDTKKKKKKRFGFF